MANTFFGFNTAINDHSERLGSSPEDIEGLEAEEEYDALNDETFGALEAEGDLEDWEAQHEQLAEIAESSRYSSDIESFLDNLDLDDFAYVNNYKQNEKRKNSLLDNSIKASFNQNESPAKSSHSPNFFNNQRHQNVSASPRPSAPVVPKLQTVEELERMLLHQAKPLINQQTIQQILNFQHQHPPNGPPPRFPPGFHMLPGNNQMWPHPQQQQGPNAGPCGPNQGMPPPGMMRMMGPPHGRMPPPPHMMGPGPPPGFMYGHHPNHPNHPNSGFPMNPHFNFPPPPRLMPGMHAPQRNNQYPGGNVKPHPQQSYQPQHPTNRNNPGSGDTKDEYAGLMNNREKQWLLNIQLLQVNTGTPYFDDYYYTVFKERQSKNKENQPEQKMNNQRYHNNRYQQQGHNHGHARDGNVGHHNRGGNQENRQQDSSQNPLNKKVYIPLQFENSLGKLQFGSVTAPRKIIDMDIITLEKDSENSNNSRDSRKTKQLLLELEALYTLILKAEDLKNPVAIQNTEKLIELKQKQRLREIDVAQTPEQKQEILKLLQQESIAPVENQSEILARIIGALLQDDKLQSFLGIRKGKMMLLRVLPQLSIDNYATQLTEIWQKLFLSIPLIGRRDTIGDNILPRFYTLFKRFINGLNMDQILDLILILIETIKLENSRSTPLSHQSKLPLHFILQNKFGVSAISSLLQRVDTLLVDCTEKQQFDWSNFMSSLVDTLQMSGGGMVTPIEPISEQTLHRLADKAGGLSFDKRQLLEKTFVDVDV